MNAVSWFEIPVKDLARAQKFYERVLDITMQAPRMPGMKMVMFPGDPKYPGSAGALVPSDTAVPSQQGTIVYLNCRDISRELQRVEENGGKVLFPKTDIGEDGYFAHFCDTEGNRVGLYSMQ